MLSLANAAEQLKRQPWKAYLEHNGCESAIASNCRPGPSLGLATAASAVPARRQASCMPPLRLHINRNLQLRTSFCGMQATRQAVQAASGGAWLRPAVALLGRRTALFSSSTGGGWKALRSRHGASGRRPLRPLAAVAAGEHVPPAAAQAAAPAESEAAPQRIGKRKVALYVGYEGTAYRGRFLSACTTCFKCAALATGRRQLHIRPAAAAPLLPALPTSRQPLLPPACRPADADGYSPHRDD